AIDRVPAGGAVANRADLTRLVRWEVPAVADLLEDADVYTAECWREAAAVGLVAHDVLTPLGAALVASDGAALLDAARSMVGPAPTAHVPDRGRRAQARPGPGTRRGLRPAQRGHDAAGRDRERAVAGRPRARPARPDGAHLRQPAGGGARRTAGRRVRPGGRG